MQHSVTTQEANNESQAVTLYEPQLVHCLLELISFIVPKHSCMGGCQSKPHFWNWGKLPEIVCISH